jgi:CheY-like chemotaxis protein
MTPARRPTTILAADDDAEDRLFLQDALAEAQLAEACYFVADGAEVMDYLYQRGRYAGDNARPVPDMILLDLKMPRKDGFAVLQEIKADASLQPITVVVLTSSQADEDLARAYDLGANLFITKPVTYSGLVNILQVLGHYWQRLAELPRERQGDEDGG